VDLLNEISRRFPGVVRLIRYAPEDKSLLRGFVGWPPCHLTQQMDSRETEAGLAAAFQVAEWMAKPAIKALIPNMGRLPTVPELYTKVMDLLASPYASAKEVGQLIARDPALTVKMLQTVNSAVFALASPVTNAVEAVMFLGTERTKALILMANTSLHFDLSACEGFSQDEFWRHSLTTAELARSIVQMESQDAKLAEEAFTAGLLHDVGKLLFAANYTQKYSQMLAVARNQRMTDGEAERLTFGASHAELGACLLGTWGLPLNFLRAISWHHLPSDSGERGFSLLTAVHAANALDHANHDDPENPTASRLDHLYLTRFDLTARVMRWRELGLAQQANAA
jgi:HD-like signal output (HDOD) protein